MCYSSYFNYFNYFLIVRNTIIQINIWQKGEVDIESFSENLLEIFQNALYDVFLEFYLLCTPICDIPPPLQVSNSSSREPIYYHRSSFSHVRSSVQSSSSSSATTPKFGKTFTNQIRNSSEPSTPIETCLKSTEDLAGSISKDVLRSTEASPAMETKQRDSPNILKDFSKKDSPTLHRKLSARLA